MCPNPNIAFLSSYEASNKFTLALLLELSEPGGQYTNYNQGQNRDKQGLKRDQQEQKGGKQGQNRDNKTTKQQQ